MDKIKMFWWNEEANFGDAMNPIILDKVFKTRAVWSDLSTARLVGAGSCLQWVAKAAISNPHDILVWGTGYIFDEEPPVRDDRVNHIAVRGHKSRVFGELVDDIILGDPGLLAPLLFDKPVKKHYKIGIVPHLWNLNDGLLSSVSATNHSIRIIDVRMDPLSVIKQIAQCDFIFSSSLHGLVVADGFNIPNQWITFEKKPFGGSWKFYDYYSVFDITAPTPRDFHEFIVQDESLSELVANFEPRNGVKEIQDNLVNSLNNELHNNSKYLH